MKNKKINPFDYDYKNDKEAHEKFEQQKKSDKLWNSMKLPEGVKPEWKDKDDEEEKVIVIDDTRDGTLEFEKDWGMLHYVFDGLVMQKRILFLCKEKNLTTALAEKKMDIPNGTLKKIHKNIPSAERVFHIAHYFNVSADYLLGITDRKRNFNYGELTRLWETLAQDQQKYVIGFIKGIIKYEQDLKNEIRPFTFADRRKKHLEKQIDELQNELEILAK